MNTGRHWRLALDTAHPEWPEGRPAGGDSRPYLVRPRSVAILKHPVGDAAAPPVTPDADEGAGATNGPRSRFDAGLSNSLLGLSRSPVREESQAGESEAGRAE